jgi:hypothetical protein
MVLCGYRYGQMQKLVAERARWVKDAAVQIVNLEETLKGNEAVTKRFHDLLAREPELKAEYDKLKKKAP